MGPWGAETPPAGPSGAGENFVSRLVLSALFTHAQGDDQSKNDGAATYSVPPRESRVIPADLTIDTPVANKIVILGRVPSIRVGDGFEVLPGIIETCAAGDPRVTREDDDGGVL